MPQTDLIPEAWRGHAQRMAGALRSADSVLVAAHVNPDGDAVGSVAAAGHVLKALGKAFFLCLTPGVPADLSFLELPAAAHATLAQAPFAPRCALLLDCGEPHRLGDELAARLPGLPSLNIDHHVGAGMGTLATWVEPQAAATAQLVAYVAVAAGLALQGPLAEALALGLVTDTGGFAHGNTSGDVLRLAAHLRDQGCDIPRLRAQLDNCWSEGRLRLWGRLQGRAELLRGGEVAFCAVTREDFAATGTGKEDMEGFAEFLRRLRGVRMTAVLREDGPGLCKFSLRSSGPVDVRAMAAELGGGGHRNAAGGSVAAGLAEARHSLLAAITRGLDGRVP